MEIAENMKQKHPAIHQYARIMREIKRRVELVDFFLIGKVLSHTHEGGRRR